MTGTSSTYLSLNLLGSAVLTVLAVSEKQLGFLLLEACWAAVSAWGIAQQLRRRELSAQAH